MSFLKVDWTKFADVAKLVVGPILAALGVNPVVATVVTAGINEAEGIPGASGADKKTHVLNLTQLVLASADALAGHDVVDTNSTLTAVSSGIDAAIAVINVVRSAKQAPVPGVPTIVPATVQQ